MVSAFTIDPTTSVATLKSAVASVGGTWAVAAHPSGKFLYVLGSTDIASYAINPANGDLQQILGQTVSFTGTTWMITCDPTGAFVLMTAGDNVYSLTVASDGRLANAGSVNISGAGLRDIVCDSTGRFAYVAASTASAIEVVSIQPVTGALSLASSAPALMSARTLCVDGTNKFVYVGSSSTSVKQVAAFSRDPITGAVAAIGSPVTVTGPVYGVVTDPDGKHLYVACDETTGVNPSGINQFKIEANGSLTPLSPPFVAGGDWPLEAAMDQAGKFVFVPNYFADTITGFTRDPSTGRLTVNGPDVKCGSTTAAPHGLTLVK